MNRRCFSSGKLVAAIFVSALLTTACNGGGGDASGGTRNSSLIGYFYDAPVAGLDYRACSPVGNCRTGVTGGEGQFQYQSGDVIQFSLAGLYLGEVAGQPLVTPYQLSDQLANVTPVLQLLQSLDSDNDPSNGISIDAATRQRAGATFNASTSFSGANVAQVVATLRPGATLISAEQASVHAQASQTIDRLLRADSEVAKAILGQKYYNLADPQFNVAKLNSSMRARMMLQLYYDKTHMLSDSFEMLKANYEGIEHTRDTSQAAIDTVKGLVDIGIMTTAGEAENSLEVAQQVAELSTLFVSTVNSAAKTGGMLSDFDEIQLNGMTLDDETIGAINLLASGISALGSEPDIADLSNFSANRTNYFLAQSEGQQTAINSINAGIQCVMAFKEPKLDAVLGCFAGEVELVVRAVVDLYSAGKLSGNNENMRAHIAAQKYLEAYYKSAGDPQFMLKAYGIPSGIKDAADYFDSNAEYGSLNKSFFVNQVSRFIGDISQLSKYYGTHLGLNMQSPSVQLVSTSGVLDGQKIGQGVSAEFQAQVTAPSGVTVQSVDWYVHGVLGKLYELRSSTPLQQNQSTATVVFKGAGTYNVTAVVHAQNAAGDESVGVGLFTVQAMPYPGVLNLSPDTPGDRSVGDVITIWVSDLWSGVKSIVVRIGTAIQEILGIADGGNSASTTVTLRNLGEQPVAISYYDQVAGQGNLVGYQALSITVAEAKPDPVVLQQAVRQSDGRVLVAGLAQMGVAVRVTWPDAATSTTTADNGTGQWSVTSGATDYVQGQSVQAVAYNNVGTSTVRTMVIAGASSATRKLPHTGITASQCYQAGGNGLVSCTSSEATSLNSQQDGMRTGVNPMAYSLVPKAGGGTYDKTECVKDDVTGLVWEGKTASGLRAGSNTYTNYHSSYSGTQAQMDAATNTYGYVAAVNAQGLCGYSDWRLPTVDELLSIVDYGVASPGPTINSTWFPNTPALMSYWSSSPHVGISNHAWYVLFGYGNVRYVFRSYDYAVRLVRASQ